MRATAGDLPSFPSRGLLAFSLPYLLLLVPRIALDTSDAPPVGSHHAKGGERQIRERNDFEPSWEEEEWTALAQTKGGEGHCESEIRDRGPG